MKVDVIEQVDQKKINEEVERIKKVNTIRTFHLELTEAEALLLRMILGRVGGGAGVARMFVDSLYDRLGRVGLTYSVTSNPIQGTLKITE